MSNFCLGWRNHILTGPVVVSAAAAGAMAGDQLQNDQGNAAAAWQTPSGTRTGTILLARPAATRWRMFGLFRTNLTTAASMQVRVYVGGVNGTLVYNATVTGVAAGYGQIVHVMPIEVAGDTAQIEVSDPTNPDGFLNVPLCYAGSAWQPKRNYSYQSAPGREDDAASTSTRAGGSYDRLNWQRRNFDLTLALVDAADVQPQLSDLDLVARRRGNVLFVPDPQSPNLQAEALFGPCRPQSGITYPYTTSRFRGWRAMLTERL